MTRKQILSEAKRVLKSASKTLEKAKRALKGRQNRGYNQSNSKRTRTRSARRLQGGAAGAGGGRDSGAPLESVDGQQAPDPGGEGLGQAVADIATGRLGSEQPDLSGIRGSAVVYQRAVGDPQQGKVGRLYSKDGQPPTLEELEALALAERKRRAASLKKETKKI